MKRRHALTILQRTGAWLVAVMLGVLCAHGIATGAETVKPPKSITVAMDDNYPPYIFRDKEEKLQGILVDTWALWSTKTGVTANIRATDWGKAQALVHTGKADVLDTLFITDARLQWLDFSKPYAKIEVPIFFHKSISGITDAKSLTGFAVGVKEGDASIEWLTARGVDNLKQYPSYEAIIAAAKNNEIRVFCMDKPPAMYLIYKNKMEGDFRYTGTLYSGEFHWATKKGHHILHKMVEDGFAQISEQERKAIDDRWKGSSLNSDLDLQYVKYISYVLLLVFGIAAAMVLLNWYLRRKVSVKTAELSATLDALRASERYNRMLFEDTTVGLCLSRIDGTNVDVNRAYAEILGYWMQEILNLPNDKITPREYIALDQEQREELLACGHYGPYEKEYIHKLGHRVPVRIFGSLVEFGENQYILSIVENIAVHKDAQDRIHFLAFHDPLTGLANRQLAQDRFEQVMAHADRIDAKVALIFFDLDNFKNINDSLGHACGDALLKALADRLSRIMRETDTISRQGGDEFLILLPALADLSSVTASLAKIMSCLEESFLIDGHELTTSISAGVTIYPDDGEDFDTLLKNADIAMYQAKEAGRNTYRFFDEKMHTNAMERMRLSSRLRKALDRNELQLHYQPLVDIASGTVIGAEALLRWTHAELGAVSPARFIPVAEDSGMIVPIGAWVLHEACRQAVAWKNAGWHGLQMAVNLSAVQFRRDDLEQTVISALETSGIDPTMLELELTESILITDTESVLATVRRLKSLGIKLSIDDFGTGYSSLSYLKRFDVDKLKIDRSFISGLTNDPDDAAIVRAIIQMARNLSLRTIAEGVEDARTLEWLRVFQCNEAQGYFYAPPIPAEKFVEFLERRAVEGGR